MMITNVFSLCLPVQLTKEDLQARGAVDIHMVVRYMVQSTQTRQEGESQLTYLTGLERFQ